MTEQSLKDKTVKGVAWSGLDNVAQFGVTFVVSIILARLLSPDDYGLLGILAIFTAICGALVNSGFNVALIRKIDVSDDDYNTTFVVNLIISVLLYFTLYLCAPLISSFFNREELIILTRVSSIGIIIGALAIVQQTRLTVQIDFKTQTKITLCASFFSGIIGIGMALLGFGVWALVFQGLSAQSVRTALLWFYNKWIPRWAFSKDSFNSLFGFGWKIMISNLLDTVWKEMYQVVVGKFYSPATLGQYTRSNGFSQLLSNNLTNVVQRVSYPVLSSIQNEKERMVDAYRRIIKVTMYICVTSMFLMAAVSEPLLYCLIGPKWHEAAIYLPLICLAGSTYPLQSLNLNMLEVQGRSDLFLVLEILKKIIAVGPLLVGATIGILPMLYFNLLTTVIAFFLNSHYSGKLIGYSSWMQIKDVSVSYGISIVMAVLVFLLKYLPISYWIILPTQILLGICTIVAMSKFLKIKEYDETLLILKPYLNKFFKVDKL